MNISEEIKNAVLDIETRSQEALRGAFILSSNGKFIIKDEAERYEELLKDLAAVKEYEKYVSAHRRLVKKYEYLKSRANDRNALGVAPEKDTDKKIVQENGATISDSEERIIQGPSAPQTGVSSPLNDMEHGAIKEELEDDTVKKEDDKKIVQENGATVSDPEERIIQGSGAPRTGVSSPLVDMERGAIKEELEDDTVKKEDDKKIVQENGATVSDPEERIIQGSGAPRTGVSSPLVDMERGAITVNFNDEKKALVDESEQTNNKSDEQLFQDSSIYSFRRDQIIQDIPFRDKTPQIFETPGMPLDMIIESQNKINSVPEIDYKTYVDPLQAEIDRRMAEADKAKKKNEGGSTHEMTPEEIEEARKRIAQSDPKKDDNSRPMTEEEIEESRRKISGSDSETFIIDDADLQQPKEDKKEKKTGKKRKVTNRKKFDWKNNIITQGFGKAYVVIKGLVFGENVTGRTKDYAMISSQIGNFRANYKTRTPEVNNIGLEAIDKKIVESSQLTFEEKKLLYKKLAKMARKVVRLNRKQQADAIKNSNSIAEELSKAR